MGLSFNFFVIHNYCQILNLVIILVTKHNLIIVFVCYYMSSNVNIVRRHTTHILIFEQKLVMALLACRRVQLSVIPHGASLIQQPPLVVPQAHTHQQLIMS